jgi:hypothetical protein
MHVDAQDFGEQGVDVLPAMQQVAGAAAIADRDVKIPVGPEAEPPGFVEGGEVDWSIERIGVALAGSTTFGFEEST